MGFNKKIKEIALRHDKKIGKDAVMKLNSILEEELNRLIQKAIKQADISGRKVIKIEDVQ